MPSNSMLATLLKVSLVFRYSPPETNVQCHFGSISNIIPQFIFCYIMKKSGKNGRRRKDVEFEEIMGNLNSRKRQERKDERENGINREM